MKKQRYDLPSFIREVGTVLDDATLAQREIDNSISLHPHHKEALWNSFLLLIRTDTLISDTLYQSHINELLGRVMRKEDTRPATAAEMLGAISCASARAPLNNIGLLVFTALTKKAFHPNQTMTSLADDIAATTGIERVKGQVQAEINSLSVRLYNASRVSAHVCEWEVAA